MLDLIHKNVQNLDGIGIHNLSLIAESTTDCPLLREIIGKYYDSSGLFFTDDLVETISLCDVKVVPFLCENQEDHKNKMEKIVSFSQKIGKNELVLVNAEKLSQSKNSNRTDDESRNSKILLMPTLPRKLKKMSQIQNLF